MEEWKEIKSIRTQCGTTIKWNISNKGRVKLEAYYNDIKLDEEILSLGHCVYIHNGELITYMLGCCLYRTVYELFVSDIPKGYQIHHKDYNHYNNELSNLECLSPREHGKRHDILDELFITNTNKVKEIQTKYVNYTREDASNDLKTIYKRFDDKNKEYKIEYKTKQKEDRRQKYIDDKLSTGNYILKDGKLVCINRPKWTNERRQKVEESRSNSDAWKNRSDKIRGTLKEYFKQPDNRKKQLEQLAYIREIRLNKLNE